MFSVTILKWLRCSDDCTCMGCAHPNSTNKSNALKQPSQSQRRMAKFYTWVVSINLAKASSKKSTLWTDWLWTGDINRVLLTGPLLHWNEFAFVRNWEGAISPILPPFKKSMAVQLFNHFSILVVGYDADIQRGLPREKHLCLLKVWTKQVRFFTPRDSTVPTFLWITSMSMNSTRKSNGFNIYLVCQGCCWLIYSH